MEQAFVDWLSEHYGDALEDCLQISIGDDAAIFSPGDHDLVVACDAIADGTHFDTSVHALSFIGRKVIAINLSDIAAMGAVPKYATLSFFVPKSYSLDQVKNIFEGAAEIADNYGVKIIGGDTNSWEGKLVVSANVIGVSENPPWKLGTAKVGDLIVVTGEFGGSILGHHIEFDPKCDLAKHFSGNLAIHAATDVTDSLAIDLLAMCKHSKLGAEVELSRIPVSQAAAKLSVNGSRRTPLEHALYDGEDFELILAVDPKCVDEFLKDDEFGCELSVIGKFVPGGEMTAVNETGEREELMIDGYRH